MPELPEVQSVCASLAPRILGREIRSVAVRRTEVVVGSTTPEAMLVGRRFTAIRRHGKQIALLAGDDALPAICVHLGMTGSLCHRPADDPAVRAAIASPRGGRSKSVKDSGESMEVRHLHALWQLDDGTWLVFRDPRRFGGLWTYPTFADLILERWGELGPDALTARPAELFARLGATGRPLKAALLDQGLLAGLGNIYVDELLHERRLHPLTPANALSASDVKGLVGSMRRLLARAIRAGGSSLRDYVDGEGKSGSFQLTHRVYGRGGEHCRRCRTTLQTLTVGGRTTVACPKCQPGPAGAGNPNGSKQRRR
ncbi:MAG: bifunctional DNA-formamidopyrimidine glycosylase/DNA-(apurinic or apyrimidinic site) lyase [Planctomycetota bacterium]|nr:bifunctional DNA-formamidopyrimidine glycosylase/DNA-(apurinic or apyrimidinic site) lyase [Planctomycetota bacterium]